jgi:hypothetical protein
VLFGPDGASADAAWTDLAVFVEMAKWVRKLADVEPLKVIRLLSEVSSASDPLRLEPRGQGGGARRRCAGRRCA